ncbi:MAG: response regulator [Rhizobiaceae bacterium]|nr:response regulator [Rhizobiaceae bacterium]MCV0406874.1 response regulator [Rhizobiaceae bacterium]
MIVAQEAESETILIVDGDVITRTVIAEYLRHCGFRVLEAGTGAEAMQALQHAEFSIDIVLSDVELPGDVSGFALSQRIRKSMPQVKILLAGAVERIADTAGDLCEEGPHLAKPYDQRLILEHIKRLRAR